MEVQRDGRSFTVEVTADGEGLVSYAGAALPAEAADRLGLTHAPDFPSSRAHGLAHRGVIASSVSAVLHIRHTT